jgi:hypothetical protein
MLQTSYKDVFDLIPKNCLECESGLQSQLLDRNQIYYSCDNRSCQYDSTYYFTINKNIGYLPDYFNLELDEECQKDYNSRTLFTYVFYNKNLILKKLNDQLFYEKIDLNVNWKSKQDILAAIKEILIFS